MAKKFDAREIAIQLERELIDDFGETAFAISRNLIFGSPVGNPTLWQEPDSAPPGYVGGHFRRNWQVSIGGFVDTEIEGEDSSGASTAAKARSAINQYTRFGPNLVIQNNAPYANRLAQGHSTQAPSGWVDEAINAAVDLPRGTEDLP